MSRAQSLVQRLGSAALWTGGQTAAIPTRSTGYAALDQALPGHGWPLGALTELVPSAHGIGELSLLLPTLQRIGNEDKRPIVFIRPPYLPYPPALARAGLPLASVLQITPRNDDDARWAAEQTLRAGVAGAVLLWSAVDDDMPLRRLQLAAQQGQALAFLYRAPASLRNASPAALRLALQPARQALRVRVIKARGGGGERSLLCPLRACA